MSGFHFTEPCRHLVSYLRNINTIYISILIPSNTSYVLILNPLLPLPFVVVSTLYPALDSPVLVFENASEATVFCNLSRNLHTTLFNHNSACIYRYMQTTTLSVYSQVKPLPKFQPLSTNRHNAPTLPSKPPKKTRLKRSFPIIPKRSALPWHIPWLLHKTHLLQ